jgi:mannose-6-phosphate isomerase-like protein (cupin superfamily)
MQFDVAKLLAEREAFDADGYREFLTVPTMKAGIYVLPAGGKDSQLPHEEDEIYYGLRGRGVLRLENYGEVEDFPVFPGSILFVPAQIRHHFRDFAEELQLLVFFSAAKG